MARWAVNKCRILAYKLSLLRIVITGVEIIEVRLRIVELPDILPFLVCRIRARRYARNTIRIVIHQLHKVAALVGDGIGAAQMIGMDVARDGRAGHRAVDEFLVDRGEKGIAIPNVIGARGVCRAARKRRRERVELIRIVCRRRRARLHDARSKFVVGIRCRGVAEASCKHMVEIVPYVAPACACGEIAVSVVRIGCRRHACVGYNAAESKCARHCGKRSLSISTIDEVHG